jgi:hypothetical protein
MRTIAMLILPAALLLHACAPVSTRPSQLDAKTFQPDQTCRPDANNECRVTIDPRDNWAPKALTVIVSSEVDETKNPTIVFDASGYWFDKQTGITWDDPGKAIFKCEREKFNVGVFRCTNKGKKKEGGYAYTIDLVGWPPFDPWVLNK